jgi:hypothetical protein
MRLSKHSRPWPKHLGPGELKFCRQVSAAVTQYRGSDFDDAFPLALCSDLEAHLVPFDEQGKTGPSCQIVVKDFDERGITFQHPQPLHHRRALVVLEGLNLGRIAAEVDLSWCRFSGRGQYTSGGRFVCLVNKTA